MNPFGTVAPPPGVEEFDSGNLGGLQLLLNIVLRSLIVFAGVYAVISLVLAGYSYISASGDPKRVSDATAKIWHAVVGFTVAAGAFVLAGLIGEILYNDANAILQIRYFTAN